MNEQLKLQVLEVLARHKLCVIATVDEQSRPEAAIVGFSHSETLELLIGTSHKTRKYANLMRNPHSAVVIGDTIAEVQYEGAVRQLEQAELNDQLKERFQKLPGNEQYLQDPEQAWLLITPKWLRLTVHGNPNRIEEMSRFV